jgi:hypothetical protein
VVRIPSQPSVGEIAAANAEQGIEFVHLIRAPPGVFMPDRRDARDRYADLGGADTDVPLHRRSQRETR